MAVKNSVQTKRDPSSGFMIDFYNRYTCLSYPDQHLRPNKRIDIESVQHSEVQTRYCILPAGGFQSETESAAEGMLLIIFRGRQLCITRGIWSHFITSKTRAELRFTLGKHDCDETLLIRQASPNVYSTRGPCPQSWPWPIWWSWWHDPGVWIDSRYPPVVFVRHSHDPLLQPENHE